MYLNKISDSLLSFTAFEIVIQTSISFLFEKKGNVCNRCLIINESVHSNPYNSHVHPRSLEFVDCERPIPS